MSKTLSGTYTANGYLLAGANQSVLNPITVTGSIDLGAGTNGGALVGPFVASGVWTIANQGRITGETAAAIALAGGGLVTNSGTGLLSGHQGISINGGVPASVTNSATINAVNAGSTESSNQSVGVLLAAGGTVLNQPTGHIVAQGTGVDILGGAGTVVNDGAISGSYYEGIYIDHGSVTNIAGASIAGGSNAAAGWGVVIRNTGVLSNAGTITGTGQAGAFLGGGSVTNTGSIGGTYGIAIRGAPGTVVNSGIVTGSRESGVFLTGGTVTNAAGGSISGISGITVRDAVGTVINNGFIGGASTAAGYSVYLASGFAHRLIANPGAVFSGQVDGGNTIGSSIVSTLELGAAAQQGTLGGIGTQFINFGQTTVDAGASWALTGASAMPAGGTLLNHGTLALNGVLTVDGMVSEAAALLTLGQSGTGRLVVENQGSILSSGSVSANTGLDIGQTAGQSGEVLVIGAGSSLNNLGRFAVGDGGFGSLSIRQGGTVTTSPGLVAGLPGAIVASTSSASGSLIDVSGVGSKFNVTGLLDVGDTGSGSLQLSDGAVVTAGTLDAGVTSSAVANISLSGPGTQLTVSGAATVADDGTGVLSVLSGATLVASSLTIGSQGNSSGALVVSGVGSVVQLSGALNIGTALGIGDLTVGPGAAVHASVVNLQGQVVLEGGLLDPTVQLINQGQTAGGFGTIAAGDIIDEGVIQAGGNKASQKLLLVQGNVLGGGTLTVNGAQPGSSPSGVLQINAGGTMELTGAVLNAATTTFNDNLTPAGTYTVNNSVIDVTFADAAGVLKLDDIAGFAGTITTHQAGDSFVITGGTLSGLNVSNGNTLTALDSGSGAGAGGIDSIIFGAAISASGFNIVNSNTIQQVACFAAGTRIETETGSVAVEALAVGDRAVLADGGCEPIVWIGQRAVNCRAHPDPETVWPIRVRAGAFGQGLPVRDLYLSPDHAVFVNDVLVPVKLLTNGTSIAQVKRDRVTYFHVELSRHEVILAEELPVESYLDAGDRANFAQDGATIRLFPDFTARLAPELWETRGAAPVAMTGVKLAAALAAVAANAPRRKRNYRVR